MWEGYTRSLEDLEKRCDLNLTLLDHLKNNLSSLRLKTCHNLLSVGPGSGIVDGGFMAALPYLKVYTGVEPDVGHILKLQTKLAQFTDVKKEYMRDTIQSYNGPNEPCDVILMSHVVYHFSDVLEEQLRRALSWLTDSGKILLVIDKDSLFSSVGTLFYNEWKESTSIFAEDVRKCLNKMNIKYEERDIPYCLDLSHPGDGYYNFVSNSLNRKATREEIDKALSCYQKFYLPGTKIISTKQTLFIIEKQK